MRKQYWKLIRRNAFGEISIYYLEGTKADLFALIGYIYSCDAVGTNRIDYVNVPAIIAIPGNRRYAKSKDFCLPYYFGGRDAT